ncbi:MAG: hypothetical protein M1818_005189 [Claussenomyces sp. TS43310]|nr:MAG: hypothetical protein M1818_005189 [Claussenomyces sp. TS43310]
MPRRTTTASFTHIREPAVKLDLLNLPPEIRDEVYSHIIPTERLFILLLADSKPGYFEFDRGYGFPGLDTAVFRVCHQMHAEALAFWFRRARFRIEFGERLKYPSPEHWPKPAWTITTRTVAKMVNIQLKMTMVLSAPESTARDQDVMVLENGYLLRQHIDRLTRAFQLEKCLRLLDIEVVDQVKDGLALYSLAKRESAKNFLPIFKLVLRGIISPMQSLQGLDRVTLTGGPLSTDIPLEHIAPLSEQENRAVAGIFLKDIASYEKQWAQPPISCWSDGMKIVRSVGPSLTYRTANGNSYILRIAGRDNRPPSVVHIHTVSGV